MKFRDLCQHCDRLRQLGLHPLSEVVIFDGTLGGELQALTLTLERGRVVIHPDVPDIYALVAESQEERE